jgi:hypothetical protein
MTDTFARILGKAIGFACQRRRGQMSRHTCKLCDCIFRNDREEGSGANVT